MHISLLGHLCLKLGMERILIQEEKRYNSNLASFSIL